MPSIIDPANVRFCYRREEKGPIAKELGIQIYVDDRIEVLNAVHDVGVSLKILFTGVHDERAVFGYPAIAIAFDGLRLQNSGTKSTK